MQKNQSKRKEHVKNIFNNVYSSFNNTTDNDSSSSFFTNFMKKFNKDTQNVDSFMNENLTQHLHNEFDKLASDEIGYLFNILNYEQEEADSPTTSTILNTIKDSLGKYTISRLSNLISISQEEIVTNSSNHTQQEKENAETEINDILSNIDIENLAEIYPLISEESLKAQDNIKWMGLYAYDKPIENNTLPLVGERITQEIIKQSPTLVTSKNRDTYKKLYESMSQPISPKSLSSNTKNSNADNFRSAIYSYFEQATNPLNGTILHLCMNMYNIINEVDITNIVNITKEYLTTKNNHSLPINHVPLFDENDINEQFSLIYNKLSDPSRVIDEITNQQVEILNNQDSTQEEIDSAILTIDACNYVLDMEKNFNKNNTTTKSSDNFTDDNVM